MPPPPLTVVDAANVVGSRPDGWWRDRAGAARRLVETIAAGRSGDEEIVVVLEGRAREGVPAGERDGVAVVHAAGSGDDAIVAIVAAEAETEGRRAVTVITSDRELRERVEALGAVSHSPRAFLDRL